MYKDAHILLKVNIICLEFSVLVIIFHLGNNLFKIIQFSLNHVVEDTLQCKKKK